MCERCLLRAGTGDGGGTLTWGDPSEPCSLVFLASLFFFLCRGLVSKIISSSSNVGSQLSLPLCNTRQDVRVGLWLDGETVTILYPSAPRLLRGRNVVKRPLTSFLCHFSLVCEPLKCSWFHV